MSCSAISSGPADCFSGSRPRAMDTDRPSATNTAAGPAIAAQSSGVPLEEEGIRMDFECLYTIGLEG